MQQRTVLNQSAAQAGDAASPRGAGNAPLYVGTFLVAAATIALEVVFTRIFSFTIWYHFSYLAINAALLGFCSSGAVLAMWPALVRRGGARLLCICALLSATLMVLFLFSCASYPLEPNELFEKPGRFAWTISMYYVGIAAPFFFAGVSVVGALSLRPAQMAKVYFADLAGAGCGAALALGLMTIVKPPVAALLCALLLVVAAAAFAMEVRRLSFYAIVAVGLVAAPLIFLQFRNVEFLSAQSTYVGLFQRAPQEHRPLHSEWNAISRIDVFESTNPLSNWSFPQWTYDGKSELYSMSPANRPRFYHMLYDAHNRSDVYQFDRAGTKPGAADRLEFLDHHLLKTPYLLKSAPRVLVMGSGGGIDVINAYRNGAESIVAVDLQPAVVDLLNSSLANWVGDLYADPRVTLVADEGRSFLRRNTGKYDLIQFTATDTWAAQNTGAYVLTESYLYTQEAISEYLAHLSDDGVLCLLVWDGVSEQGAPRQPINSRLIVQYLNILSAKGVAAPRQHLTILGKREWYGNIFTVPLLKMSPFTKAEVDTLRAFAARMGFQVLYDPFHESAPNALNRLIDASPSVRARMVAESPYRIDATTDQSPFFFNIFRWTSISGLDRMTWSQPMSGQLVLIVMLLQSLLMALVGIFLPLALRRKSKDAPPLPRRAMLYFLCLGSGYMFIEIAMIQKFIVFLGYPTYAFASVIASLLIASGVGSYWTSRYPGENTLAYALLGLAGILGAYQWLLPAVFDGFLAKGLPTRVLITAILQAPVGFVLGLFMPIGLNRLIGHDPAWIPWAWGLNGMAAVVATVLSIILAMTYGFTLVLAIACCAYAVAAIALLRAPWNVQPSASSALKPAA